MAVTDGEQSSSAAGPEDSARDRGADPFTVHRSPFTPEPGPLTLVILAAGLGTRFGGLKQLEPVGPGGNTLMDYSIYDAARAGFGRVVFVIRPELVDTFHSALATRYRSRLRVTFALQHMSLSPGPARTRPLGTAHALLVAAPRISGPFAEGTGKRKIRNDSRKGRRSDE